MLRGSSRNINCLKFSSLRTGHATQPTRGAGKRKKVFVVLRDKIFFPRARWTFFFDFRCELFKRLDAQSIRVVLSLFITRDFEISREKRTSRNRFVRSSKLFSSRLPPLAFHGVTARNSFLAQKFVKSFLSESETTSALN